MVQSFLKLPAVVPGIVLGLWIHTPNPNTVGFNFGVAFSAPLSLGVLALVPGTGVAAVLQVIGTAIALPAGNPLSLTSTAILAAIFTVVIAIIRIFLFAPTATEDPPTT